MRCALIQEFSADSSDAITPPMSSGNPTRPSAVSDAICVLKDFKDRQQNRNRTRGARENSASDRAATLCWSAHPRSG